MADLCTTAQVKTALNIGNTTKDTLIDSLVDAATAWIERYCDRTFSSTTQTDYFSPGHGDWRVQGDSTILVPKHYPIISVTSLHESASRSFSPAYLIAAAGYYAEDHRVVLYADQAPGAFTAGQRTVRLVYVAGYAAIPADLERAAIMLCVHLFRAADKLQQGIASQSMGDMTVTFKDEEMPKEVRGILDLFRRPFGF